MKLPYQKKILKNGLTLLTVPVDSAESVTVSIFVKAGSRYEPLKLNGISHFLEHLHFKGSRKYPSAKKLSETVDSIGGEFNANTGKEHTQYFIRAHNRHLPLVMDVLSDMLKNPLFDAKEIEREKGVIIEEINMYRDNPQVHVESLFEETLWPDTALGRDIAGKTEVIRGISRQDIVAFRNRFYQPKNMIIAAAGKFGTDDLEKLVERHWGKTANKPFGGFEKIREKQGAPRLIVENKPTEQAHMIIGFNSYRYADKKNFALKLLSVILGGGMSSRLFIQVRERRGLAYYVRASVNNYLDTGNFIIQAGLKTDKTVDALKLVLSELKKVTVTAVTAKELKQAKEYIKGKVALSLEDSHERLDWYLGQEAFIGKIKTVEESMREFERVSAQEVRRVAREVIRNDRLNLALIGPFNNKDVFKDRLKL